ncbi:unnamed protein product, partial [Polarella glacialis]
VNTQNLKGQTSLHMSSEYDMYFISKRLFEAGADGEVVNADGFKAILGISGSKSGAEAWDMPLNMLKNSSSKEDLDVAFAALETCDPTSLDKATFAMTGMKKGKEIPAAWDKARFMAIMGKI